MGKDPVVTTALPEGLDNVENMSKEARESIVKEYVEKRTKRFHDKLAEQAKSLEEKLKDKASKDRVLIVKKLQLSMLKQQIKDRKSAIKHLRAEVKLIKQANKKVKSGVVVQQKTA